MSTRTLSASGRTLLIWADTRCFPLAGGIVEGMDHGRLAARDGREARDGGADLGALEHQRVVVGVACRDRRAVTIHLLAHGTASRLERGHALREAGGGAHLR